MMGASSSVLTVPLKGVYFDEIQAGTKREEYRLRSNHWQTRLVGREHARVVLTRGYPKAGGVEGETRLTRKWRGYEMREIVHPHFGPEPVEVFALDVSVPASVDTLPKGQDGEAGLVRSKGSAVAAGETPNE